MHLNCDGARDVHGIVEERIWIGTSGWTYDSWRGRFYPRHIPKHGWLSWYATQFATAERGGEGPHSALRAGGARKR